MTSSKDLSADTKIKITVKSKKDRVRHFLCYSKEFDTTIVYSKRIIGGRSKDFEDL